MTTFSLRQWRRFAGLPWKIMDSLISSMMFVLVCLELALGGASPSDRNVNILSYALAALCIAPLVFRRKRPLEVFLVIAGAAVIYYYVESPDRFENAQTFPLVWAIYAVTVYDRRRWSLAITFAVATFLNAVDLKWDVIDTEMIGSQTLIVAVIAIGSVVRSRREQADQAEHQRDQDALRMVDDERIRIARELHDILAHSIAAITVQAGMAEHIFDSNPTAARQAVHEIRELSKTALSELRATLGVLRSATEPEEERSPSPHLDQIDELVATTENAGVHVSLSVSGPHRGIPPAIDMTAYRIVQEALTNVVRHAGRGASATVAIGYENGSLDVHVRDAGPLDGFPQTLPPPGSKLGLIGMRERVLSVGGKLKTGPSDHGGFEVHAVLPTGDAK